MKLHFKNLAEGPDAREHIIPLDSTEDFEALVDKFPQLAQSLYAHNDIRKAAEEMAAYLSSHYMDAWITD